MAKDPPVREEKPANAGGEASDRPNTEIARTVDDDSLEGEREALKNAREAEIQNFASDGAVDRYGNLHFGDQNRDESVHDGGLGHDGFADDLNAVAPALSGREARAPGGGDAGAEARDNGAGGRSDNVPQEAGDARFQPRDRQDAPPADTLSSAQPGVAPAADVGYSRQEFSAQSARGAAQGGEPANDHHAPVNEAPTDITLTADSAAENAPGAVIASLSAIDPDFGETAVFSIAADESGLFEIVDGALKLKDGAAFDFEAQDSYVITLRVTDSAGNVFEKSVTINATDVNEAPEDLNVAGAAFAENAQGAIVATLSAADPDAGDSLIFSIADDPSGLFEVVGDQLKLKAGAAADFEHQASYDLTLRATDSAGNTVERTVTVNVADVNEAPTDISLSGFSAAENQAGAVVATLSAADPDFADSAAFSIAEDASGFFEIVGDELRLKPGVSLDHEVQDSYTLTLRVTDSAGNVFDKAVTINVADVNETPTDISLSAFDAAENDAGAVVATLSAADPDFADSAAFSIAEDASGLFEVVGDELRLKPGVSLDHEVQDVYDLTLRVTDGAGNVFDKAVTINVADVNETPTDILLSAFDAAENDAGAVIGALSAIDPDFADSAAFSIVEDASGFFEIVGDELRLKPGVSLDYEAQNAYDLTLRVTDSAGNVYDKAVTINVADGNEAPGAASLSSTGILENVDGAVVGTLSAPDPDAGDAVSYTVSDDRFEVVGDQLKLKSGVSFDYETAAPINVTVTATDSGGLTSEQAFTLTVENANEAPALGFASSAGLKASYYNVGHSLSDLDQVDFSATPDAEGVVDSLNYMQGQERFWEGGPADYFAAKYEGQLVVENGGTYTFSMASDDGSMLFIDGVAVIDNDGLHGTQTRTVTLDLDPGAHAIEVRYFENGGSQTLRLQWSGPDTGGATQVIGGDAYQHGYSADALSAPEDTPGAVIAELTVSDPDAGDAHVFSVSDDRFEVVNEDGAWLLKLKDGETLDYEAEPAVDVAVTVTDSGGASSTMDLSIAVENVNAGPQISLIGGEGLKASYYNIGHSLSDLDQVDFNAAPDAEGVVDSLNYTQGQQAFWDGAPGDYFAAKYEGQVIVAEGGTYTFSLASDDGSMLFIDGVAVIDNDGLHSTSTRTVTLDLDSGAHDIEVRYFENTGSATLQLSWSGPDTGGVTEVIGGDTYRLPGVTDADRLGVTENVAGDHAALLSVADPDGDAVTLTVSDDRFEVVEGESGYVLKLKDGESLNHETESEIHVTVTATDSHGESASESFDIPVADIAEVPTGFTVTPVSPAGVLSLNMDGGNNDAAVAADMAGFPTDALTVEVAFSSTQTNVGDGMPLFSYAASNGSDNEALLFLEGASGNLQVFLAGTKINTGIANASLLDGEQHQVSFTWDQATNELKVYVDGAPAYETSVDIRDLKAGGSLVLGQEQDSERGGYTTNQTFKGEISEVRIFDYARSPGEIADHAGAPIGNPDTEPGLVNNWVMNASANGAVEDLVGADNLVLENGAYVEPGAAFDAPTVIENQPGAVAGVLSATDPDHGGPVTEFVIVSDPSGAFEIDGDKIKLKDGVSLNHETAASHDVTVAAIGASGDAAEMTFTVTVADLDEAPAGFALQPASTPLALALNMDGGADDAAIAANLEGFPTDALTVEVSFASTQADVGAGAPLFSYAASGGSDNEVLLFLEGASDKLVVYLAGQSFNTGIANASLLDGARHQVSVSWDQASNELKVYVDGESAFETSVNIRDLRTGGAVAFGQEQDSEGGGFNAGQVFEGEIYEARIFDYARAPEDIAEHAAGPLADPGTEPGLVNNWVMTNAPGGAIEDLAGADDLLLVNGAQVTMSVLSDAPMVVENDPGAVIGSLSAIDPETGGPVTQFVITDDASGAFEIVGDQLKLKAGVALDYETAQSHEITINAVGAGGETTAMTFVIAVADAADFNVIGGTGDNDTLSGTGLADMISGGDGADTLRGRGGDDVIHGGAGNDAMRGDAGADTLYGDEGNDNLRGNGGDDVIYGGDGADNIAGNAGADELYGGAGDDRIYVDANDTVIDGGEGFDRVIVQGADGVSIDMAASNVERVDGGAGADVIDAGGMTDGAQQFGNGGDDVLTGGSGNDTQRGGAGDDVIYGGDGNDDIRGNAGADALYGGDGDDRIYADAADTMIDGGEGYDRVIVQGGDGATVDMAASNVERVDGGAGGDIIDASGMSERAEQYGGGGDDTLTGGSGDDVQRGGAGDDVIYGNDGNDDMRGGAGADYLYGGASDDAIRGDAGDDRLTGGAGDDRLYGGDGVDTVVFSGDRADYTVEQLNATTYRVTDNRPDAPDGTDRVYAAEIFEFADQSVSAENILNLPPTEISLAPAAASRTVAAPVGNGHITTSDGGGSASATVTFNGAAAGGGVVTLAFAAVDNSFELLVNGESLTGEVVQLQSNVYNAANQAFLQFADGSAITQPWTASANGAPRIIVQITETGVDVLATRTPGSSHYESMTLVNGVFTPPSFIEGDNIVTVVNPNDDGPDGLTATISAQYEEAVTGPVEGVDGAVVGTLSAADADASAAPGFAIVDDPSGMFEISGDQLKVKDGMSLDYDSQSSHQILVEATDEYGATYQETVTVDVQEAPPVSQFLIGGAGDDLISGGAGDDALYGGDGDDTLAGGRGDDFMSGGEGSDMFLYAMGEGSDQIQGGAGWTDTIQLQDGAAPLGQFGADWTVELTQGSVVSSDEHGVIFSQDADGAITLSDGSVISFTDIEEITY